MHSNRSWTQQARRLLKPEEVIAIDPRLAITFTPGVPPVCTRLSRYYEERQLTKPKGLLSRLMSGASMLFLALICFGLSIGFAMGVSMFASQLLNHSSHPYANFQQ